MHEEEGNNQSTCVGIARNNGECSTSERRWAESGR